MAKLPEPPAPHVLAALPPMLATLSAGALLSRVYFRGGRHPGAWSTFRSFGPTRSRFDHHDPPAAVHASKTILYAAHGAQGGPTCLAEVFQDTRTIDRTRHAPWLVVFALARSISLLDLMGLWPTRAGASSAICSGPRPRAQRWARTIHTAYPKVEGLLYGSSMNANAPAVALFERAQPALAAVPALDLPLADPSLHKALSNAAAMLNYALV